MPSFTTLLEDTSPLLVYSQANWQAGASASDNLFDKYSEASFMLSQTPGATVTFSFNGTSVAVYGAKRANHGQYTVTLDNTNPTPFSGTSDTEQFQNQLYNSGDLVLGTHNLTLANAEAKYLDVDYITFKTNVGRDDEVMIVNTFQSAHPAFSYSPLSLWKVPSQVERFMGGSGHATTESSANMTFQFQVKPGDAVALYGPVGPSAASYTVQIDGGSRRIYSANKVVYRSQQVLFFASNLGTGVHTLQVETSASGELAIDYATAYTTKSMGGSLLSDTAVVNNATGSDTRTSTFHRTPKIMIAGLAALSAILLLMSFGCVFITLRLRRTRKSLTELLRVGVLDPEFESTVRPFLVEATQTVDDGQLAGVSVENVNAGFTTVDLAAPGRASIRDVKPHRPRPSISSSSSHQAAPPRYQLEPSVT